jgi:nucleotide-binding universal stress UspA family protein
MMKVLIAYDGSQGADIAIDGLQRAGLPHDTEALLLSVADVWPHLPPSYFDAAGASVEHMAPVARKAHKLAAESMAEARTRSVHGLNRVIDKFPGWKVHADISAGSPHEGIIVKADEWKADLVVLGSQGHSAIGRMLLGSVAQKVVQYSLCSVRVVRARPQRSAGALRIVVGIDASTNAAMALDVVARRAWPANTEVKVVMAMDARLETALPIIVEARLDWAPRMMEDAARELRSAGLLATPVRLEGDPKKVLLDEAEKWNADCIFVGARGLGRVERFLLGSVSAAVSAQASCSVEVVRSAAV